MSAATIMPGSMSLPSICLRCARTIARRQDTSAAAAARSWRGQQQQPAQRQHSFIQQQYREYRTGGKVQSNAAALSTTGREEEAVLAAVSDRRFFWANAFHGKGRTGAPQRPMATAARIEEDELPHRRRKRLKEEASMTGAGELDRQQAGHGEAQKTNSGEAEEPPLPFDASTTLAQDAAAAPARSFRRVFSTYLALTKPRLAFLIVLTTTASYSIYPVPALLSSSVTSAPSLSTLTLFFLTTGTFLAISSANTLNMLFEPQHDAKMSRTKNRPLVRGLVSPRAARLFAVATGVAGTLLLWYGVHPTTALLGAANILLYAYAYTPLKRIHPVNTWVGAVVGAIPPLMGWCAAGSQYITTSTGGPGGYSASLLDESAELLLGPSAVGGWLLAALLFAWQFPHFFALSHAVRGEYAHAGYRMLTSTNIPMAARVSLRYSLAMFPICVGLCWAHVTDPPFAVLSAGINAWMAREAWAFWTKNGEHGSARKLFWASVWQLPIVLVLAMVLKRGLWGRVWSGIFGEEDELLDDEEE